jgi:hypothetical protein
MTPRNNRRRIRVRLIPVLILAVVGVLLISALTQAGPSLDVSRQRPTPSVYPGRPTFTPAPASVIPEAPSLLLLGSGIVSLGGYAALQLRARRK